MRAWACAGVVCCGLAVLAGCGGASGSPGGGSQQTAPKAPTANAGGPYSGIAGTAISFSSTGSSDPQGQTLTYAWNFGDNTTATGASPTHTYATTGIYTVSLTVTDTSGLTGTATAKATANLADSALTGMVYSGTQPVSGAHVYLLAANTTGYGGAGIAASTSNASVSLLNPSLTGASDSWGAYVTTNSSGAFSVSGDYTCATGQQLYLYATGAAGASWMAAVGACPGASGPAITATLNEVSTVAAAYALAGFATDATHISSSGTALAQTGIANAFANAANLATSAGVALATTPAGNGAAPQAEINTLANILASCSSGGAQCATLFANATVDGTATGTQPTETSTAAINIAHRPGVNITSLYVLATAGTPPFAPGLTSAPNDWTVGIVISGGGLSAVRWIAIDGQGNAWVADDNATASGQSAITEIASSGAFLSGPNGYRGGGLDNPKGIVMDTAGNAWTSLLIPTSPTTTVGSVVEISSAGTILSGANGYPAPASALPVSLAADGSGNVWGTDGTSMIEFSSSGTVAQTFSLPVTVGVSLLNLAIDGSGDLWVGGLEGHGSTVIKMTSSGTNLSGSGFSVGSITSTPQGVAVDSLGDFWMVGPSCCIPSPLVEISGNGTLLGGPSGYSVYGLTGAEGLAIDGNNNVWIPNAPTNSVAEFSNTGANISNVVYTAGGAMQEPDDVAIDGSGNVWLVNFSNATVAEVIGAAAPVVTPLSVGVRDNKLGTRP